jgi:hypothetical protein
VIFPPNRASSERKASKGRDQLYETVTGPKNVQNKKQKIDEFLSHTHAPLAFT